MTLHSRQSSTCAFVAPRGLIPSSKASRGTAASCITPDGTRFRSPHQPLEMMMGGFEMEAFGFAKDVLTAAVMGGSGDIIAQFAEQKRASSTMDGSDLLLPKELAAADNEPFELDVRRSLSYATFAAGYTGAFQHFLFANLQDAIADPLVRTGLNQGLIIPICYYSLLVFLLPKLRARSPREEETLRSSIDVKKMIPRNWLFWVPLQWIQFTFIPTELQVVYVSVLGLIWNICLSLMTAGGAKASSPVVAAEKGVIPALQNSKMVADVKITLSNAGAGQSRELVNAYQSADGRPSRQFGNAEERGARWMQLLSGEEERKASAVPAKRSQQEKAKEEDLFSVFRR